MSKNKNKVNNGNVNNVPNNEAAVKEEANVGGVSTPDVDQNGNVQNPPAVTEGSEKKSLKDKFDEAFDPETHPKRYAVKEGAKKVGKALGWMALGGVIVTGGLAVAAMSKKEDDEPEEMDEDIDYSEDLDDDDNVIDSTAEEVETE